MAAWNDQTTTSQGFTGTVGQLFSQTYPGQDAYAIWVGQGGQPNCADSGYNAHPTSYLGNCASPPTGTGGVTSTGVPATAGTGLDSLVNWLQQRQLAGQPNYLWIGGALIAAVIVKNKRF